VTVPSVLSAVTSRGTRHNIYNIPRPIHWVSLLNSNLRRLMTYNVEGFFSWIWPQIKSTADLLYVADLFWMYFDDSSNLYTLF